MTTWNIISVPGDGNCWIYAICVGLQQIHGFEVEPFEIRHKMADFIKNMEIKSNQESNQVAFETIRRALLLMVNKVLVSKLTEVVSPGKPFETIIHLFRTSDPNNCLWAGIFEMELNLLATVLDIYIAVLVYEKEIVTRYEIKEQTGFWTLLDPVLCDGKNRYRICLGETQDGRSIYLRNIFRPWESSTESILDSRPQVVSIFYINGNHYNAALPPCIGNTFTQFQALIHSLK